MRKLLTVLLFLGLAGCASNSGVVPIGQDTYMVSRQAATGFSGSGDLKARAFEEANQYCVNHGKKLEVVSTHEASPPYVFGNFPKADVQFMCLDANDPQLTRPHLEKEADVVIKRDDTLKANVDVQGNQASDLYTQLMKLNELRKDGILTEDEFQAQKKLLLDKQQ